jgi:hypothetical protein
MPRDIHGKPVKPEALDQLREHHDRLTKIEEQLGLAKKADAFKGEAQGGPAKAGAGHVTEKAGPSYSRRRH